VTEDPRRAGIQAALAKARRFLADGDTLLSVEGYDSAVDRFYYAVYHAASAALASRGVEAKSHEGLRNLFGLHLVRPGLLPAESAAALRRLHADRIDADYLQYLSVGEEEAREAAELANAFVTAIEGLLAG
jgi:uncharacterized protein (UPF0332 family)